MNYKNITTEEFGNLSADEKLNVILSLNETYESAKIIELCSVIAENELSPQVLGELAKAYNNYEEYDTAIALLKSVPTENRDAVWYYRCGYSYMRLAGDLNNDFESNANQSLSLLDKAIEISQNDEVIEYCAELVYYSNLRNIILNHKEKYPLIYQEFQKFDEKEKTETDFNAEKYKRPKQYKKSP